MANGQRKEPKDRPSPEPARVRHLHPRPIYPPKKH